MMKRSHSFCGQLRSRLAGAGSSGSDGDAEGLAPLPSCSDWKQNWANCPRHLLLPNNNNNNDDDVTPTLSGFFISPLLLDSYINSQFVTQLVTAL